MPLAFLLAAVSEKGSSAELIRQTMKWFCIYWVVFEVSSFDFWLPPPHPFHFQKNKVQCLQIFDLWERERERDYVFFLRTHLGHEGDGGGIAMSSNKKRQCTYISPVWARREKWSWCCSDSSTARRRGVEERDRGTQETREEPEEAVTGRVGNNEDGEQQFKHNNMDSSTTT
jgi:hypothetical protein